MKNKQQWLGLYEDESRWLQGLVEKARHAPWDFEQEKDRAVFSEIIGMKLNNLMHLFGQPQEKESRSKNRLQSKT